MDLGGLGSGRGVQPEGDVASPAARGDPRLQAGDPRQADGEQLRPLSVPDVAQPLPAGGRGSGDDLGAVQLDGVLRLPPLGPQGEGAPAGRRDTARRALVGTERADD